MKQVFLTVVFCFVSIGTSQTSKSVTIIAFITASNKLEGSMDKVLGLKSQFREPQSSGSVTRDIVIHRLYESFQHFKPSFKIHPRPTKFDVEKLKKQNQKSFSEATDLVKWGLVPPFSPVVTAPDDRLSAKEIGDALGYFYAQVSYLSHKATPQFTPGLEPDGG